MNVPINSQQTSGELDVLFANQGKIEAGEGACFSVANIGTDKLLYVISADNNSVRINQARADGSDDPVFTSFDWSFLKTGNCAASSILIQPDGKFLVVGEVGPSFGRLAAISRFNSSGSSDLVFGTKNFPLPVDPLPPGHKVVTDIAKGCILTDGVVLLVQSFTEADSAGGTVDRVGVVRCYDTGGNPDLSFGVAGKLEVRFKGEYSQVEGIAALPDGGFVLLGSIKRISDNQIHSRAVLASYNRDGTPKTTFADKGVWEYDQESQFGRLAVSGNKIVMSTMVGIANGEKRLAILRFERNGVLDPTFNNGAPRLVDLDPRYIVIGGVVVQADEKIVVTGHSGARGSQMYCLRLLENGQPDTGFGNGGIAQRLEGRMRDCVIQNNTSRIIIATDEHSSDGTPEAKVFGVLG